MKREEEVFIKNGVIYVSEKRYLRYIKEGNELLKEDLEKISTLRPKGWVKIRNQIQYHLRWINNKHLQLDDRAFAFVRWLDTREKFRAFLDA